MSQVGTSLTAPCGFTGSGHWTGASEEERDFGDLGTALYSRFFLLLAISRSSMASGSRLSASRFQIQSVFPESQARTKLRHHHSLAPVLCLVAGERKLILLLESWSRKEVLPAWSLVATPQGQRVSMGFSRNHRNPNIKEVSNLKGKPLAKGLENN